MLMQGRHKGFSLIELMIATTIGLTLLSGLLYLFTSFSRAQTDRLMTLRLQQELRAIMNVMINDIRRAGYWSGAAMAWKPPNANGFTNVQLIGGDCLLYTYDARKDDKDGIPDSEDHGGFKLDKGRIRIRTSASPCQGGKCGTCDSGVWWTLNDEKSVSITRLQFRQVIKMAAGILPGTRQLHQRIDIVLEGALVQAPAMSRTMRGSVYLPNAAVLISSP